MIRYKKLYRWVWVPSFFVLLAFSMQMGLNGLANQPGIKKKILTGISEKTGYTADLASIQLPLFPSPRVIVHHACLSKPRIFTGHFTEVTAYPRILPLLTGKLAISRLRIRESYIQLHFPDHGWKTSITDVDLTDLIFESVSVPFRFLATRMDELEVTLQNGRLNVFKKDERIFNFDNLNGFISSGPETVRVNLHSTSSLWDQMVISGSVDLQNFVGSGLLQCTNFRPQRLFDHYFSSASNLWNLGETHLNLTLDWETQGPDNFQADLTGSVPQLTLIGKKQSLAFNISRLAAAAQKTSDTTTISLNALHMVEPELNLTGTARFSRTSTENRLKLHGTAVDVASVRHHALALIGDEPITREIFHVIRGGHVPDITIQTRADSIQDLWQAENTKIQGHIQQGNIFAPGADLELSRVHGDVTVTQGILEGRNLSASMADSHGQNGSLTLGLMGGDAPFHLDLAIDADLAQLPPVLNHLIHWNPLNRELALLRNLNGRASGRLILGESFDALQTRVDVSNFQLSAAYGRLPFPITVSGGPFNFDVDRITAENISAGMKSSRLGGLEFGIDWQKTPELSLKARKSRIKLDEIYPWLSGLPGAADRLKAIDTLKGHIKTESMVVDGPLFDPGTWQFQIRGNIDNLTMDSSGLLPELFSSAPVKAVRGGFSINPETVTFKNVQAEILDATLNLSGQLQGYTRGIDQAELRGSGRLNDLAVRNFSNFLLLPSRFHLQSPLSLTATTVRWGRDMDTSFKGNLSIENGPDLTIDVNLNPEDLKVRSLAIKDPKSDALFKIDRTPTILDIHFRGHLDHSTLARLLIDNPGINGSISGDIRAHLVPDAPAQSILDGHFKGRDLILSRQEAPPLTIDIIKFNGAIKTILLESTVLTLGNEPLHLKGYADITPTGLFLDMDLEADTIDWTTIQPLFQQQGHADNRKTSEKRPDFPLSGTIRFQTGNFTFEPFTWRPLNGHIDLDQNRTDVILTDADLCGIATPVKLSVSPSEIQLALKPSSRKQDLNQTVACLLKQPDWISGRFSLDGKIEGQAAPSALFEALTADLEFKARKGRIFRYGLLAKILEMLNITKVIRGKLPDFRKEGFAYDQIEARVNVKKGVLEIKDGIIEGPSMKIAFKGDIHLQKQLLDVTVLVAPLQTVNIIIDNIPLVGGILGGGLYAVPLKIVGRLDEPKIHPISPSAATSGLVGVLKRTIKLPVKILKPVLPSGNQATTD